MLSVIIPVYNAANYLRKCLDSVAGQDLKDIEIICVDDGSADDSAGILAEYDVKVIRQENHGQGYARNRGLEQASGEYVYFMDADDELADEKILKRLVEEMEKARLDVLFFDAEAKFEDGFNASNCAVNPRDYIRTHNYTGVYSGQELFSKFLENNEYCVSPCMMMLRRSFLEDNYLRFPAGRIYHEDNIFMTQVMLAAKRASHRPWRGYLRSVHNGSVMTSAKTEYHLRGYEVCYDDVARLLKMRNWNRRTRLLLCERKLGYSKQISCLKNQPHRWSEILFGFYICFRCRGWRYILEKFLARMMLHG